METATVEEGAGTVDAGVSANKRGSWRRDLLVGLLVVGIVAAGIEGVAFAAWVNGDVPASLLIGAVFGFGVIVAVVRLASSLGGGHSPERRGLAGGLRTTCLVAVAVSMFAMLGIAVLVPVGIQINLVEDPHLVPSTIASAEGQRELLLNGVTVTLSLVLATAFIGLLVLRRRRSARAAVV